MAPAMSEAAPELLGKYRLLQPLARGGMAELYLARQQGVAGIEKTVVIKRVLPHLAKYKDFVGMFLDEARIAAQLDHPNIVQLFEFGEVDGNYYIAMEYLAGEDLTALARAAKRRERRIPESLAAYVFAAACDGLQHAHTFVDATGRALNIVHRDISPSNIFVTYQGAVKLLDFGIAKAEGKLTRTRTGLRKGKSLYMSPEQVRGDPLDGRSDVFALGSVLYEVLIGEPAFLRDTELDTLRAILFEPVEPPHTKLPSMSATMEAIILKALATSLDDRFSSALQMRKALEEVLVEQATGDAQVQLQAYVRELMGEERVARRLRPPSFAGPGSQVATPSPREPAGSSLDGDPGRLAPPVSGNRMLDAPNGLYGAMVRAGHDRVAASAGWEAADAGGALGASRGGPHAHRGMVEPAASSTRDGAECEQGVRPDGDLPAPGGASGNPGWRRGRTAALAVAGLLGGAALLYGAAMIYRKTVASSRDREAIDLIGATFAGSTADASSTAAGQGPLPDRAAGEGQPRPKGMAVDPDVALAPRVESPRRVPLSDVAAAPSTAFARRAAPAAAAPAGSLAAPDGGVQDLSNAGAKAPRSLPKAMGAPANAEAFGSPGSSIPDEGIGTAGQLRIHCQKPCRILIDGHDLRLIAPRMLNVPAGRHRVRAVDIATEEVRERLVDVPPGGRESVSF